MGDLLTIVLAGTAIGFTFAVSSFVFRRLARAFDKVDKLVIDNAVMAQRLAVLEALAKKKAAELYELRLAHAGNHAMAKARAG